MSKPLTPAVQSAILRRCTWLPNGKMRVTCTHSTEPLLKKAGIPEPKPFVNYEISVRRDEAGFLVIDTNSSGFVAAAIESDESLYEKGGIFADDPAADVLAQVQRNRDAGIFPLMTPEAVEGFSELCEIPCTRTFEVSTGTHSKVRIQVIGFEDTSLPSPNEIERWKPSKPSNTEIHAGIAALYMARTLSNFEKL